MGKNKSRKRHSSNKNNVPALIVEYYKGPFFLFEDQLNASNYISTISHPIRERFWSLLTPREYLPLEARSLLISYIKCVETQMSEIISKQSIAYWLHLYRRVFPGSIGEDNQPQTIGLTRATLEAAIQKYAQFEPCNRVGISGNIGPEKIFAGLLMSKEFDFERKIVTEFSQLVLTDFGPNELREFYDLERLAYEMWRTSAMLRIVGKGASIEIGGKPDFVIDSRSNELDFLVRNFDNRTGLAGKYISSATGVFVENINKDYDGVVFAPHYNLGKLSAEDLKRIFKIFFKNIITPEFVPNFIFFPLNIRNWRQNHLPFSEVFNEKYSIPLDVVLLIITALLSRAFFLQIEKGLQDFSRYWQRAYEGPNLLNLVEDEIFYFVPHAAELLGIDEKIYVKADILNGIKFLTLNKENRADIELSCPGPHYLFLPFGSDRLFIDYAWIDRRLYDLFLGVPTDKVNQNFKGDLLERIVRHDTAVLPVKPCKAKDGTSKQIDASFEYGQRLVIVECKSAGRSIDLDRGNPVAINKRNIFITESLKKLDEKAVWLSNHPIGGNYDVSKYLDILPILVTPFAEFIPSLDSFYWLDEEIPRIITLQELENLLDNESLGVFKKNIFPINKPISF